MTKEWSDDIELMLSKIRLNALMRSKYHKASYFLMLGRLKYFRIPVIILSAFSSVFSIALQNLVHQEVVSLTCCFLSLLVGLIGSLELFLQVQKQMEIDLHSAKGFHNIGSSITKMLILLPENRAVDGTSFLDETFNDYTNLVESSIINDRTLHDKLLGLDLIESNITPDQNMKLLNDTIQVQEVIDPASTPSSPRTMLNIFSRSASLAGTVNNTPRNPITRLDISRLNSAV